MCPCVYPHVCGYHRQVIEDLAERLAEAESAGDDSQRSLRGELASYGWKAEAVSTARRAESGSVDA